MIALAQPLEVVNGYIQGVLSGEIVTGLWVRKAVERHVRDLQRQGDPDFPFYFDEAEAEDACLFFPVAFKHHKSEWAGRHFELSPWQCFCNAVLLGWKRVQTQEEIDAGKVPRRRFKRAHVSVARKNGKTTWAAGLAIYLAFADGEAAAEVYIGATKIEQARLLFRDASAMVRQSKTLGDYSNLLKDNIAFPKSESFIRPLGSDRPFDGLNPHAVFFDELHAWREIHRGFYDTMRTGSGARPQPIICTITTAGDEKSYLWIEESEYVQSVLEGTVEDENIFGYIASLDDEDDPFDESTWIKANPNLGVSVSYEYIRELATEATANPMARNRLLRYHCNRKTSSTERAFDLDLWDAAEEELSDWRDADAIAAGFDLGGRDDLASYALCARFLDGETDEGQPIYRYEVRQRSFMHAETERDLTQQPWKLWVSGGQIAVSRYPIQELRDALISDCEDYGISDVAFDPHSATQLAGELEQEGLSPIKMAQNYAQYNEPIRSFMALLTEGKLRQDGDPVLRWCASNAVVVKDKTDRWMFDKASSKEKIDPIVASVMAYRACMLAKSQMTGKAFFI